MFPTRGHKTGLVAPQGGKLPDDEQLEFDEFTCLTVSISVPESQLSLPTTKALPAMVYIHGGAAQDGCGHVDGIHDNAPLTAFSHSIFLPVIVVNIGYRLNWVGSIVCQDLLDEHTSNPTSTHGPFNLTIQDQRNAFAWIHKFVGGLGGDVSNITAFGESTGSIFMLYHIIGSEQRMFDRAILSIRSGYQALLKHFNINGENGQERLEQLRHVDAAALAKFPGTHTMPFVGEVPGIKREDSLFTRGSPTYSSQFELIPTNKWLGDMMIGDDLWEGQTIFEMLKRAQPKALVEMVSSLFGNDVAQELLEAYEIPISGDIDSNRFLLQLSYFIGDVLFSVPIDKLAKILATAETSGIEARRRKIYRYSIAFSNPFADSTRSFAPGHRFGEILYLFLTVLERYPARRGKWLEQQARGTARRWITFAYEQAPWDDHRISADGTDASEAKIAIADDLQG
ncbi:uncharacterized protein A1O9_08035 [Exophiala aquamarina CBS 119918]|uniref:Carboxylesterase type B domain-containing protein n=1 Tax=Exophiala aquamarina CBS 119918 TaxID=1182545 RepID=A0A072P8M4_9EURO|nr:uncharacterized protein A1O9_08035 [Exophiala aquamarina CBS 119918]KEF56454.1 hypothetical protein A1O9_08035 [Exophiala aquamarina CBS 119918]